MKNYFVNKVMKSERLISEDILMQILEYPLELLVVLKLNNPFREKLAAQLVKQFSFLNKIEQSTTLQIFYLIAIAANLTEYAFYEEDDKEGEYWEIIKTADLKLDKIAIKPEKKAQWKALIGFIFLQIKYYAPAINAYKNAISLIVNIKSERWNLQKYYEKLLECYYK